MAVEDFTTYTETDPNSRITVSSGTIGCVGLTRNEDAYVYKDFGAGHFTDFTHTFSYKFISGNSIDSIFGSWGLGNGINDYEAWGGASITGVWNLHLKFNNNVYLWESYGGSTYNDSYSAANTDTVYYVKNEKSGTTMTSKIYSDSGMTNLLDTLSLVLHANHSFRYAFGMNTWNSGRTEYCSGEVNNLDLNESAATYRRRMLMGTGI